jgi:hypothetical protein
VSILLFPLVEDSPPPLSRLPSLLLTASEGVASLFESFAFVLSSEEEVLGTVGLLMLDEELPGSFSFAAAAAA